MACGPRRLLEPCTVSVQFPLSQSRQKREMSGMVACHILRRGDSNIIRHAPVKTAGDHFAPALESRFGWRTKPNEIRGPRTRGPGHEETEAAQTEGGIGRTRGSATPNGTARRGGSAGVTDSPRARGPWGSTLRPPGEGTMPFRCLAMVPQSWELALVCRSALECCVRWHPEG